MIFAALIPVIGEIIDKIFPDPAQANAAKLELMKLQIADKQFTENLEDQAQKRINDLQTAQIEVNKVEAASPNLFVSGGRPAVIWICAAGLAWQFFLLPVLNFILPVCHVAIPALPAMDLSELMPLLMSLLGVAGMRSFERVKGVIPKGR